jgi:hypothetical protein
MVARTVFTLLACLVLIASAQAQDTKALIIQGDTAYAQGKYAESAGLYAKAIAGGAKGSTVFYNAACSFALSGSKDSAFYYLNQSVRSGWIDIDHMQQDSDLITLRVDPRWKACIEKAKSNKAKISPRDYMVNDMNNLAAQAYQYRIRPKSMGGGEGSYVGFVIPEKMTSNENGKYAAAVISADTLEFNGVTPDGKSGITVRIGEKGMLHGWIWKGNFK